MKTKIKEQDESSKLLKKYYKKPKKDTDMDDIMKEINEQNKKYKLLEEQRKLLKQKTEQDKLLKQQNDELNKLLEEQQQEENILQNITFKNIDSKPFVKFRTSFPRKDIKKPTPSPSKIPAPITKSREPQGVAPGEQAGIAIMGNKLEIYYSKKYIEHLEKELRNTDFSLKEALQISDKIIKEEDEVRKLEKEIREREEDIERRFRKYYPDKYYSYKK